MAFGLIILAWHDYNGWHQPRYLVYAAAVALLFGGAAIQFRGAPRKSARLSLLRFILSSPYSACQESSPRRGFTIAGATSSSSSLSLPER